MMITYNALIDPSNTYVELQYFKGGLLRVERLALTDYVKNQISKNKEEIEAAIATPIAENEIGGTNLVGTLKESCHAFPQDVVIDGIRKPAIQIFHPSGKYERSRYHVPEDEYFFADIRTEEGKPPIYAEQTFNVLNGSLRSAFSIVDGLKRPVTRAEINRVNKILEIHAFEAPTEAPETLMFEA